jgi:hypothetical protein
VAAAEALKALREGDRNSEVAVNSPGLGGPYIALSHTVGSYRFGKNSGNINVGGGTINDNRKTITFKAGSFLLVAILALIAATGGTFYIRNHDSSALQAPSARANSSGRTTERAELAGNRPAYVSPDSPMLTPQPSVT